MFIRMRPPLERPEPHLGLYKRHHAEVSLRTGDMLERIVLIDQPQKNILLDILGFLLPAGCRERRPIHQLPVFREKLLELLLIDPDLLGYGFRFHLSSPQTPICYRSRKKNPTKAPK